MQITDDNLYLSLGLAKKMVVPINEISSITINKEVLEQKINHKTTVDFIARDFEAVDPHLILELKNPCRATLLLGLEKLYSRVAIRLDDPVRFYQELEKRIEKKSAN